MISVFVETFEPVLQFGVAQAVFGGFITVITLLLTAIQLKHQYLKYQLRNIPTFSSKFLKYTPFLGQGINLPLDPVKLYKLLIAGGKFHQEQNHNSVILWFSPINPVIGIIGAEDVEYVVRDKTYNGKHFFYDFLHEWLGTGLLTSNGKKWQKRRKLITPAFHFNILQSFVPIMNKNAKQMVKIIYDKLEKSGEKTIDFNIFPHITLSALDTISEAAMGKDIQAQTKSDQRYITAIDNTGKRVVNRMTKFWLWPAFVFKKYFSDYQSDVDFMKDFCMKVIKQRIQERKQEKNENIEMSGSKKKLAFLDMLLENYDNGEIDLEGVREEVDTFMFEGHDTTASAMNFMTHYLGHDEIRQKKVREELDEVLGGNFDSEKSFDENLENFDVSWESVGNLKYMDAVGRETLRLLPSVFFIGRAHPVMKDVGLTVLISLVNRDFRQWKDTEVFNPERFLDAGIKRHAYSWIPFSAGYRNCVGQRFAQMEMSILVAYLFKFFEIKSLQETEDLKIMPNLIIRPKDGVRVRLGLRDDFK